MNTEKTLNVEPEYIISVEGSTFKFSQGGRHPFYDNVNCLIGEGKTKQLNDYMTILRRNDVVRLHTTFEPMEYLNEKEFIEWWEKTNVNGEVKDKGSEWDSTLVRLDDDTFEIVDEISFSQLKECLGDLLK